MKGLTDTQRKFLYVAAAFAAAYLAYRWYTSRQTSASNTAGSTAAPDTTSSDYAALAGQEQGDVAALQDQNAQLMSQEQSDVAALQGQEGADVAGINQAISGFTNTVDALTSTVADVTKGQDTLGQIVAKLASGEAAVNRTLHATHATHPGGAFYRYYKRVTGHAPPAHIATSNFIYQAYKSGIKSQAITKPHPSSKNTHVSHPNGGHKQQNGAGKKLAGKDRRKSKPPPKASKPRRSGARR